MTLRLMILLPRLRLGGDGIVTVAALRVALGKLDATQQLGAYSKLCSLGTSPPADLPASGVTGVLVMTPVLVAPVFSPLLMTVARTQL